MLKRIVPFVAVLALLLPCLLVPASAAAYDLEDMAYEIIETDTTYEVVLWPAEGRLYAACVGLDETFISCEEIQPGDGFDLSHNSILFSPFGTELIASDDSGINACGIMLSTASLPDSTKFTFTATFFAVDDDFGVMAGIPVESTFGFCFPSDVLYPAGSFEDTGEAIFSLPFCHPSITRVPYSNDDYDTTTALQLSCTTDVDKSTAYTSYAFIVQFGDYITPYNFEWSSSLVFSKAAVDADPENEWSKLIHSQLDDIINRPANPKPPAGADNVTNAGEKEEQLLNSGAAGREEFNNMLGGSAASLELYTSSFAFLSACINPIIDIPWIKEILTISLGLGFTGFLLNLGASAISMASKDGSKSSKKGGSKSSNKGGSKSSNKGGGK